MQIREADGVQRVDMATAEGWEAIHIRPHGTFVLVHADAVTEIDAGAMAAIVERRALVDVLNEAATAKAGSVDILLTKEGDVVSARWVAASAGTEVYRRNQAAAWTVPS